MNSELFTYRPTTPPGRVRSGPLAGKTILIRPDLSFTGWLTDAGSRALAGFCAVLDATVVARLKAAGASFAGSTRMAELGFGLSGDTMAAALSAGHAHAGLMTDTMGEARMAACAAGLYGLKPSYGMLSRFGLVGLAPSLESIGVLARTPVDIAKLLAVMAGPDSADFSMSQESPPDFTNLASVSAKSIRIGIPRPCRDLLNPSAAAAFAAAEDNLAGAGFRILDINLPGFSLFPTVHQVIAAVEASSAAGKYDGVRYGLRVESAGNWNEMYIRTRAEAFGLRVKAFLFQGAYFQFQDYPAFEKACKLRRRLIHEGDRLFGQVDLLTLPTRTGHLDPFQADTVADTYAAFGLTLGANLSGWPALQIPDLNRNATMDFGLQLIGPRMADARLLAVGLRILTHRQEVF